MVYLHAFVIKIILLQHLDMSKTLLIQASVLAITLHGQHEVIAIAGLLQGVTSYLQLVLQTLNLDQQ